MDERAAPGEADADCKAHHVLFGHSEREKLHWNTDAESVDLAVRRQDDKGLCVGEIALGVKTDTQFRATTTGVDNLRADWLQLMPSSSSVAIACRTVKFCECHGFAELIDRRQSRAAWKESGQKLTAKGFSRFDVRRNNRSAHQGQANLERWRSDRHEALDIRHIRMLAVVNPSDITSGQD